MYRFTEVRETLSANSLYPPGVVKVVVASAVPVQLELLYALNS